MRKRHSKKGREKKVSRRDFLKVAGSAAALTAASASIGPFIRTSKAAKLEIRWLGWEHYNVKKLTAEFEKMYKCKVSAGFFDANSEAYNKLKAGGTKDFDLVMADGFWPRLYGEQGMTQPVDYGKLSKLKYAHDDFVPPKLVLLREEKGTNMVAAPNCWGGYGFTYNTAKIPAEDANTIWLVFNEKYKGRLSTSGRHDENIALAGIYVCYHNGRTKEPNFNPYRLTDEELEELKRILIKRAFIIAHQMQTHWKTAARKTSGLLLRLLLGKYKFGARSIEAVIEASRAADRLVYGLPELIAPSAARIHAQWRVDLERRIDNVRKQKGMRAVW